MRERHVFSRLIDSTFWLSSLALLLCLGQGIFGYPFRHIVHLEASRIAAGIFVIRDRGAVHWCIYGAALFLAIGSRHINLLFVLWLPSTLIVLSCANRFGSSSFDVNRSKQAAAALLIGLFAIGSNVWLARSLIAAANDEYRSTLGRTLSDRIDHFLNRLPERDRLKLAQDLCAKTPDFHVQTAIKSQAVIGSFYNGTNQTIAEDLLRSRQCTQC